MLSISSMRSGQESYYSDLAQEDYYLKGGEPEGRWHGSGASELGLQGNVEASHLRNLMLGRSPSGRSKLVKVYGDRQHQPGWDLTFSAPKSVSVLWAVAGKDFRQAIQEAHDGAVRDALNYMEYQASWTRTGKGGVNIEPCKPLIAVFPHGSSREQEPQIHSHALWQNLAIRDDGTPGAIRSHDLYTHQMAGGAAYRASLDFRLQAIGLQTERDGFAFRLKGVPEELCRFFSTRRQQIEQYLEEIDEGYSAKLAEKASVQTRANKGHIARGELFEHWYAQCLEHGFSREQAEALVSPHRGKAQDPIKEHARLSALLDDSIEELAATRGYFSDRDVIREVVPQLYGADIHFENLLPLIEVKLQERERVLPLREEPGNRLYSTVEHMDIEEQLDASARELASDNNHKLPETSIVWPAEKYMELNDGQRRAFVHVTQDTGALAIVDGFPGTGKTFFLNAVRDAYEAHGLKVIGTAVSRRAATELSDGAQIEADSVFALKRSIEKTGVSTVLSHDARMLGRALIGKGTWKAPKEKLDSKTVLIVDESTMLNTQDANYLLGKARESGAKVVLVGGTNQLPAIGPGGVFEYLKKEHGSEELTEIIRQESEWEREAIKQLYYGDMQGALNQYAEHGRVSVEEDRERSFGALTSDWHSSRSEDARESVVIAHTNADVQDLNERIQRQRKYRGELGWRWATVSGQTVHQGDIVTFQKNFSAYDARDPSTRIKINNGDIGMVRAIKVMGINRGEVEVEVELRRTKPTRMPIKRAFGIKEDNIRVRFWTKDDVALSLGYATTVHKVQGGTFEKAYVLGGGAMTSLESTFVAMSRAKKETKLYLSKDEAGEDLERFVEEASRSRTKPMAKELETMDQDRKAKEQELRAAEMERQRQEQERMERERKAPPMDRGLSR